MKNFNRKITISNIKEVFNTIVNTGFWYGSARIGDIVNTYNVYVPGNPTRVLVDFYGERVDDVGLLIIDGLRITAGSYPNNFHLIKEYPIKLSSNNIVVKIGVYNGGDGATLRNARANLTFYYD